MPESNIDSTTGATIVDTNTISGMIDETPRPINEIQLIKDISDKIDTNGMTKAEAVGTRINESTEYAQEHGQTVPYTEDNRYKDLVLHAPELTFNYNAALNSGYKPSEIVSYLEPKAKTFNIKAAREVGYSDTQILKYLIHKQDKNAKNVVGVVYGKTSDFDKGFEYAMNGVKATVEDLEHLLGLTDNNEHRKTIEDLHKYSVALNKAAQDKDFLSMFTLGRAMPSLATLPISAQTKAGIFALGAVLGYSDSRATEDVKSSAINGAIAGTVGVGLQAAGNYIANKVTGRMAQEENMKAIMNSLSPKAAKKTREYFQDLLHMSDSEVDEVLQQWRQISESTGNTELDKLLAITHNGSDEMVGLLGAMRRQDVEIFKVLRKRKVEMHNLMKGLIGSISDREFKDLLESFPAQYKVVEQNYDTVVNMLSDKYNIIARVADGEDITKMRILSEEVNDKVIPEAMQSVRTKLAKLLDKENMTVEEAIKAYRYTNDLIASSKGITKANYKKLSQKIEQHLKETLTDEDFKHWRLVNDDYAMMSRIKQSAIGKAFDKMHKGEITTDEFLNLLKLSKDGEQTFTDINNLIGSNKASSLERLIVKEFFDIKPDKLNFEAIANSLNKKGFVTTQGKTLQDYINKINKAFETENRLNQSLSRFSTPETGGLSGNIKDRFQVFFASRLFKSLLRFLPTQEGKFLRMEARLKKALLHQPDFRQLDEVVGKLSEETKAKVFTDIQKRFKDWQDYMYQQASVRVTEPAKEAAKREPISREELIKEDTLPIVKARPKYDVVPIGRPYSKTQTINPVEPNNPRPSGLLKYKSLPMVINNNLILSKIISDNIQHLSPETISALKNPQGQELLRRLLKGTISEKGFVRSLGLNDKDIMGAFSRKNDNKIQNEGVAILRLIAQYKTTVLKQIKNILDPYTGSFYHKTRAIFDPNDFDFNIAIKNNLKAKGSKGYDLGPGLYAHLDSDYYTEIPVGQRVIEYKGTNLKLLPVLNEREYLEMVKFYTGKTTAKAKEEFNKVLEELGYDGVKANQSIGHKNMAVLFKSAMKKLSGKIYLDRIKEHK